MERNSRPPITIPSRIDIPMALQSTLPNGVRLYTLDCSEQEVIRVSFVFRAGTSLQSAPFSASATANLMAEGSTRHTAQQIAEILDFHGSYYDVSLDRDYAVFTVVALSHFFEPTLDIAREILLEPSFPQEELETYASKRKQRLAVERSKVSFKARELFTSSLFGAEHPYGISYDQSLYDSLRREDIVSFYERRYTAGNCFVVCSGMVKDEHRRMIASLASQIPVGGEVSLPGFPAAQRTPFAFGAHEGAVQSAIRIGTPLFTRTHPDFIPMQVVSTALGGYFGSRLVRNLREEHGYTYGVFSTVVNLEHAGYLAIATEVATEATPDAVAQIFAEMERMRESPLPDEELHMVKNIMTGEVMRILDGPFGIADVTIENIENGTDNGYVERFISEIRGIDAAKIVEMSRKYLDPAAFTTVVVGDPALESSLAGRFG